MEEYRECLWCGEKITEGRADKVYCDKTCYNAFKNNETKEILLPIQNELKSFKNSYLALSKLVHKYDVGVEVPLTEAIQFGLDRNAPCRILSYRGKEGEFNKFGDLAYRVVNGLKEIIIYKVNNGRNS